MAEAEAIAIEREMEARRIAAQAEAELAREQQIVAQLEKDKVRILF